MSGCVFVLLCMCWFRVCAFVCLCDCVFVCLCMFFCLSRCRLVPGASTTSYGSFCARQAGIPTEIIERAGVCARVCECFACVSDVLYDVCVPLILLSPSRVRRTQTLQGDAHRETRHTTRQRQGGKVRIQGVLALSLCRSPSLSFFPHSLSLTL